MLDVGKIIGNWCIGRYRAGKDCWVREEPMLIDFILLIPRLLVLLLGIIGYIALVPLHQWLKHQEDSYWYVYRHKDR